MTGEKAHVVRAEAVVPVQELLVVLVELTRVTLAYHTFLVGVGAVEGVGD